MQRNYWVYVMASESRTLYVGVTSDLRRRVAEHRTGARGGFTVRYRVRKLVHFEQTSEPRVAIAREEQLKRWPRERKLRLVERDNPAWRDLSLDWPDRSHGA